MNRRSFLKRASGLVAAAGAALFIPSERLDFGVPKRALVLPDDLSAPGGIIRLPAESWGPPVSMTSGLRVAGVITGQSPTLSVRVQQSADTESGWEDIGEGTGPFTVTSQYVRTVVMAPSSAAPLSFLRANIDGKQHRIPFMVD